jgi:ribosomal protein S20
MIFPTFAQNDSEAPKEKTENKTQDSTGNDEKKNSNPEIGKKNPSIGGMEIPVFNPASDTVEWDGRVWKVDDNRVFRARFEKYLNSPESEISSYEPYFKLIENIMDMLSAENTSSNNLDAAFKLLPQAASYDEDANISDAIANQVLGAWQAQRQVNRVAIANKSLEEDRKRHEWNLRITSQKSSLSTAPKNPGAAAEWAKEQEIQRAARTQPHVQRLAEVNALIKSNQAKNEISEIQSRLEFQSLIVQLFLQRRFNHTLIASRFYRSIFKDGDNKLRLGERSKSLFARVADIPPTVNSIDALASEAIRDVKESVEAVKFLLSKNELESASTRLGEAFIVGEHLPEIQQFPRESRQRILVFTRNANQLLNALEVKDYTRAEQIILEMQKIAQDFDPSKPMTAVQTARNVSRMHLARARNAALTGDSKTLENELRAATEIWPNNPELSSVSDQIFTQSDVQQQAMNDFDRLLQQNNHRQIFEDRMRFIAAAALYPEKQKQLGEVLEKMSLVEAAIVKAQEISKRGDAAGAWESAEAAQKEFPDDNKLNQLRADLTTQASEFVQAINRAEDFEKKDQPGSSLAWYLKARQIYPASTFAKAGIQRLGTKVLPDAK